MKTITNAITSIFLTLSMLLMVGCQLTPEQRLETAADVAYEFGSIGALAALDADAGNRDELETVVKEIDRTLAIEGPIQFNQLKLIAQTLPLEQMNTPRAQMYVSAGSLVLRGLQRSFDSGDIPDVRPVLEQLRAGVANALSVSKDQ